MKTMKREYVRGNKEHWKEVYEWAWGKKPDEDYVCANYCFEHVKPYDEKEYTERTEEL